MKSETANRDILHLAQREALPETALAQLWRLESGALRIDSAADNSPPLFLRLVLPGDVLGIENLAGMQEPMVVRALTPSMLSPVTPQNDRQLQEVLMVAVSKGFHRMRDLISLRTGPTDIRVKRLLLALSARKSHRPDELTIHCAMPSLSDMAAIVDAAPETVCRALASLRQARFLHDGEASLSKYQPLGRRHTRLQNESALQVLA